MLYKNIDACRCDSNKNLWSIIDLGEQALTGVFPGPDEEVPAGPVELIKSDERLHSDPSIVGGAGLVQLRQSYNTDMMYGENYGYRSGLNRSMVEHLQRRVIHAKQMGTPEKGDLIIDIGSNDSTTLRAYGEGSGFELCGIDPTGKKFKEYYPSWVGLIPDFFSAENFRGKFGDRKAQVITSFSMFYDLEDPTEFMRQIHACLADDGVWIFEQSYLLTMMEMNAYDTICHEHISYYALKQIKWMADQVGFKIIDVEINDVNGGSFCVTVAKQESKLQPNGDVVDRLLQREKEYGLDTLKPYEAFREQIYQHRKDLVDFVQTAKSAGKSVYGYGASTKGNVMLQWCGFGPDDITAVAEVNPDKFGKFTPGSRIPILSEDEVKAQNPDYMIVLPWHFRSHIEMREAAWMAGGGKLVFPLPRIEVVEAKGVASVYGAPV